MGYVKFTVSEAFQKPDQSDVGWCTTCSVYAALNYRPLQNAEVKFFEDAIEIHAGRIDQNGYAVLEDPQLEPGPHTMSVQVRFPDGTVEERSALVKVPIPKLKTQQVPAKLIVGQTKEEGKYFFNFSVLAQDGSPVAGAVVRIIDREDPQGFFDLAPTGANGTVTHKMEASVDKRAVTVLVVGTSINTWRYLFRE